MNKCLVCKEKCKGKFCSSNCWNKGNKNKIIESKIRFKLRHPDKNKEYLISFRKENPDRYKELKKKNRLLERLRYPEKWKARWSDYKLRKKSCSTCSSTKNLEFHHTDYETHNGFTLCNKCHRELHFLNKKEGKTK